MLQLDTKKLLKDLHSQLYKALEIVAKHAIQYMIYELSTVNSFDKDVTEWQRDVTDILKYIGIAKANEICIEFGLIKASELQTARALSLNYGIGEFLDRNNPYLQEYMNSEYYNKNRDNFKVYSRPGESYFDYETGDWKQSNAISRTELPFVKLHPIHFFENTLVFIMPEMNKAIETTIENFDFGLYLIDK